MANFFTEVYNQDSKERFLDEIGLSKYPERWWERLFEKTRLFEKKYDKDFYSFTTAEILEFYKFLEVNSIEALMVYNMNLVKYGDWALANNLIFDGQNHFTEIDIKILNGCIAKGSLYNSILTYDQLMEACSRLNNYLDRYIMCCLFEGIKGKDFSDITRLKMSDIDMENKTATLPSGRTIPVSNDFINLCIITNEEVDYIRSDGNAMPLQPSDTIYKEKSNSRSMDVGRNVYAAICRNVDLAGLGKSVTANSIFQSGMIHYLNKKAKALGITVKQLLDDPVARESVINKFGFNINNKGRFLLKYEDFLI